MAPSDEGLQTIHVLKDISDRREAERRYRELFDNIQEGLFFSTPGGRFIEVNDAMVRMLGYAEPRRIAADRHSHAALLLARAARAARRGRWRSTATCATSRRRLRRKDGSPIHVLINAFGMYDNLGPPAADSRPDARCHRPADLPVRTASRARLLRQDSEQHAESDSGRRYRRPDQLRQPPLVRSRLRAARTAGPSACWSWLRPALSARLADALQTHADRPAGRQPGTADPARQRRGWESSPPISAPCATSRARSPASSWC